MYRKIIAATFGVALATSAVAHEMTPTYPEWEPSHVDGVWKTTMELFNKRKDVDWYEISVFDENWRTIPFVTSYYILRLKYLDHAKFDIYINKRDIGRTRYICSKSKLREVNDQKAMVSSRICSKFK